MKNRNRLTRFFGHLLSPPWQVKRYFSAASLQKIEQAIQASEQDHTGEVRFVLEHALDINDILFNKTPRARAIELFSQLGIWNTEHNNGVLIYLCLADYSFEIVADRAIDRQVGFARWNAICVAMQDMFKNKQFEAGVLYGIGSISAELEQYFPAHSAASNNELANKPLIL